MCPDDIKKEIKLLREDLRSKNQDETIKRIEILKKIIDGVPR